jgi:hypothetical protein
MFYYLYPFVAYLLTIPCTYSTYARDTLKKPTFQNMLIYNTLELSEI